MCVGFQLDPEGEVEVHVWTARVYRGQVFARLMRAFGDGHQRGTGIGKAAWLNWSLFFGRSDDGNFSVYCF